MECSKQERAGSSSRSGFQVSESDVIAGENKEVPTSSTSSNSSNSKQLSSCYCMLNNIPASFHTTDLRNFFSEQIESQLFDMFHYRHRPQIVNIIESVKVERSEGQSDANVNANSANSLKVCCCIIRFNDEASRNKFIKRYHLKFWMDKDGNDIPRRCIITKVNLNREDLQKFANKELHPPKFMPRGNIGTPNAYFLNLIRECRLPPSLIKKLGLEFPIARVFKRYSKVPFDYGTEVVELEDDPDEDEVKTGKGHAISDVYVEEVHKTGRGSSDGKLNDSDNESHPDDDDDRCEEWERHEALHDHRTTHGDMASESKERLYEQEIELQWEKGGPGLVWYTDAQFWDEQRGNFDERTADDWDVDMEGYYEPGGGDKDARDILDMRRSERARTGQESISVVKRKPVTNPHNEKIIFGAEGNSARIGEFEKHTRGIGRKVMEKLGWKDGDGLGSTIIGMANALGSEGQGPSDKRGFGYYGEKLDLGNPAKRRRDFKDYDIEAEDRVIIGTVYDKPEDLDIPEPLSRRNAPTFIKRYDTPKTAHR